MILTADLIQENQDEADTLDTNDIGMIRITDDIIETLEESLKISYKLAYDAPSCTVVMTGKLMDLSARASIGSQVFVNAMSAAVRNRQLASNCNGVVECKTVIKDIIVADLLKQGIISRDVNYTAFGYIYSEDERVATFEGVLISRESITLSNICTIFDIGNLKDTSLEFILNGRKYNMNISAAGTNVFNTSNMNVVNTDEVYDVKPASDFDSTDDLFMNRRSLLGEANTVDNTSIDEFSDLF